MTKKSSPFIISLHFEIWALPEKNDFGFGQTFSIWVLLGSCAGIGDIIICSKKFVVLLGSVRCCLGNSARRKLLPVAQFLHIVNIRTMLNRHPAWLTKRLGRPPERFRLTCSISFYGKLDGFDTDDRMKLAVSAFSDHL